MKLKYNGNLTRLLYRHIISNGSQELSGLLQLVNEKQGGIYEGESVTLEGNSIPNNLLSDYLKAAKDDGHLEAHLPRNWEMIGVYLQEE